MSEWIESHGGLREHPKLKKLARLLNIERPTAVGYLHYLWWWAMEYAPDGDLSGYDDADIADALDWPGDPAALLAALRDAGLLDGDQLHDWADYGEKLHRRRQHNAELMRKARARDKETTCDTRVDHVEDTSRATDRQTDRQDRQTREALLSLEEKEALNRLRAVAEYPFDYGKDLAYLRTLALDFPQVDVCEEVAGWCVWVLDHPLKKTSNPRSQLRTRCTKAIEFGHVKKPNGNGNGPPGDDITKGDLAYEAYYAAHPELDR